MSISSVLPMDYLASAYLTGHSGADREEIESRAADAATRVLRDHRISFEAALAAEVDRVNAGTPDARALAAYDAALAAAAAAVEPDLARAPGAYVSLGSR